MGGMQGTAAEEVGEGSKNRATEREPKKCKDIGFPP